MYQYHAWGGGWGSVFVQTVNIAAATMHLVLVPPLCDIAILHLSLCPLCAILGCQRPFGVSPKENASKLVGTVFPYRILHTGEMHFVKYYR